MIVVADTSPLNYLVLIDQIDLLPLIFGQVLLPASVYEELQHPRTSLKVRDWVANPPGWVEVRSVGAVTNPALLALDRGERDAIELALELGIATVLMDEVDGRREAERLHLEVRGTLGILERGARLGKVSFHEALQRLEQTNFRISPAVRTAFLKRNL
jgi:predicted nucleic acid-binding protein